jgi:hypothetical protein
MTAILYEIGSDGPVVTHLLKVPGPVLLGRGKDRGIRLTHRSVSRRHCVLKYQAGKWCVSDIGSANGTKLNRRKVHDGTLADGDTITVGKVSLRFQQSETRRPTLPHGRGVAPAAGQPVPGNETHRTEEIDVPSEPGAPHALGPSLVGKRYKLLEIIHRGSTATFFRSLDTKHGHNVCLKILHDSISGDVAELKRFIRGVRTAAKLRHPNIVRLYHAGHSGPRWWLAMEYVDGLSLRQVIARCGVANMLPPPRVLAIARDLVAGLEVAYERQVLHRNIKPENILLNKAGTAKLNDFALVRGIVLTTLQRITGSNEVVGDLAYMAPERAEPDGFVDCRSDLYSVGACLYTLLAGRPPFSARSPIQLLDLIRREAPVPPSRFNLSVPGPLEGIVMKCLAKSPTDRFESPMALRQELAHVARFQGLWAP